MAKRAAAAAKRRRSAGDRLSALPDEVLVEILGRLQNLEAAVRTSVLSKRWRNICYSIPNISINWPKLYGGTPTEHRFLAFASAAIDRRRGAAIRRLTANMRPCSEGLEWLQRALQLNVYELVLNLMNHSRIDAKAAFAEIISSCKSLRVLKLYYCSLPDLRGFNILTTLELRCIRSEDNEFGEELQNLTELHTLSLTCCYFKKIKISSACLKKLCINQCQATRVLLSTPKLLSLDLLSEFSSTTVTVRALLLRVLKLSTLFNFSTFNSLTTLEISRVYSEDREFGEELQNSHELHTLSLKSCKFKAINISNTFLTKLSLDRCEATHVLLYTPKLLSLDLRCTHKFDDFTVMDSSSLQFASMWIANKLQVALLRKIFEGIKYARQVMISAFDTEEPGEAFYNIPTFCNMEQLKIKKGVKKKVKYHLIMSMLANSPKLETLVVDGPNGPFSVSLRKSYEQQVQLNHIDFDDFEAGKFVFELLKFASEQSLGPKMKVTVSFMINKGFLKGFNFGYVSNGFTIGDKKHFTTKGCQSAFANYSQLRNASNGVFLHVDEVIAFKVLEVGNLESISLHKIE